MKKAGDIVRSKVLIILFVFTFAGAAGAAGAAGETQVFSDSFAGTQLSRAWEVHEGNWHVADGALTVTDGGTISLKELPGGSFAMEFEIVFPASWMTIIPLFTAPEDYAALYVGGGYWESFQMIGDEIADYVQHKDPDIARTGGFQKVKVISDYGRVRFFYDGKEKGPVSFPFRPGARVGFRTLPGSGVVKIRNFRLAKVTPPDMKIVAELPAEELGRGVIWKDRGIEGRPGASADALSVETSTGIAALKYAFANDGQFESCFARLPASAETCGRIFLAVEGDHASTHDLFVIIHDASGEQHLVMKTKLSWQGWQEIAIDLVPYVSGPREMERLSIHWGGDANQRIDFPITAVDIGVVKRVTAARMDGQIRFRNIRFAK